jgi:hypothetical protein
MCWRPLMCCALAAGLVFGNFGCSDEASEASAQNTEPEQDITVSDDTHSDAAAASDDTTTTTDLGFVIPEHEFGEGVERPRLKKDAASGPLKAGASMVWANGPIGVSMAGYSEREGLETAWSGLLKGSQGFYGRTNIKALALEVDGERLVFIKSPFMCSESYLTYATQRVLREEYGTNLDGRVISVAGHSHHNTARFWPVPPELAVVGGDSFDAEVADRLGRRLAYAVKLALDDLGPAEWGFTVIDDWDPDDKVYRDRRPVNDASYGKDPRVSLLGVRRPDGTPMTYMVNFPIHGTVLARENDLLTEDAPGYVERKIEERFFATYGQPVFGMHMQSAGGDAEPAGDSLNHPELARLERLGETAAAPIVDAWKTLTWRNTADLAVRSRLLELRHDRIYTGSELEDEFSGTNGPFTWGGWQCSGKDTEPGQSMKGDIKQCVDVGSLLQLFNIEVPYSEAHQVFLSAAQLSEVMFLTMPGEPTWSLVKYAREQIAQRQWNGQNTTGVVLGYSQDYLLYLTAPDDWFLGDYESEMSFWGPEGGRWMVDRNLELIDDILAGYAAPTFYEETPYLTPQATFEARAIEVSLTAGQLHQAPDPSYARNETVTLRFGGGDPSIGSPAVVLEREDDSGFTPVPSPNGWKEVPYGNHHYAFISLYEPTPPPSRDIAEVRDHDWVVHWQVPATLPQGTYRFQITGIAHSQPDTPAPYEITTPSFTVTPAAGTQLLINTDDLPAALRVAMTVPGVDQIASEKGSWPTAHYRLIDPTVAHTDTQHVPASLRVTISQADNVVWGPEVAEWDSNLRSAVIVLETVPLSGEYAVEVQLEGEPISAQATIATFTR